jgi:hypothetical protein
MTPRDYTTLALLILLVFVGAFGTFVMLAWFLHWSLSWSVGAVVLGMCGCGEWAYRLGRRHRENMNT